MMMNVNCNNVIHFSISLVVPRDLTRCWEGQLGIKKSVILIRFNDIILYQETNVKFFLGSFSFKKLPDSTPFLDDPVRLQTAPTGSEDRHGRGKWKTK